MTMTRIKRVLFTVMAALGLLIPVLAAPAVGAQEEIKNGLCAGSQLSVTATECADVAATEESIDDLIKTIINIFSLVVGLIAVIMIIVGGVKYITSGGDSGNVTGAKNTILYAVIGLIVVALAQLIVAFVLNTATNL